MEDMNLVALSPADIPATQSALADWCTQKQAELKVELADLEEHLLIAAGNGWKLRGLQASINRTERRITYYEKIKAAVEAGFLMVPNFPVTLLAVRVKRAKQPEVTAGYDTLRMKTARPEMLPAGEGRYVNERVEVLDKSYPEPDGKGGQKHVPLFASGDYEEPDFPYTMVKPAVIAATQAAMARKVFDTIGMVENRSGRDPIMVGQILDPRGNDRRVTFFIAWWLDTRAL